MDVSIALLRAAPAAFVVLWSTGFIGAKLGLPYAQPLTFLLLRFAVVIAILMLVALALKRPWPAKRSEYLHIGVAGVLLHGGYLSGVFSALSSGMSAGVVALIVGIQPLLTAFLSRSLVAERVTRRQWIGLALGFGGVVLVVSSRLAAGSVSAQGLAFSSLALLSITLGTLYQKRYCHDLDLWTGSSVQFIAAALALLPFALIFEHGEINWSGEFVFALGWLVLVLSLGAISLLHVLIRHGAATRVSALFYLTPPTTALMAYVVFGERLSVAALIGFVVAATGVGMVVRQR